jgi:hypothetical protein
MVRGGAQRLVILHVERSVAVEGDQRRGAEVDRISAKGQGFGRIHTTANPSSDDELDLTV